MQDSTPPAKTTAPLSRQGKAALGYATRQRWRVFPVAPGEKSPPLLDKWQVRATTDPRQIATWWSSWPTANVAVATGGASRLVVVDIDPRHGGQDSWADLVDQHELPDTLETMTGGGGTHVYFMAPEGIDLRNTAGSIGPGIDTRGSGGYVLVPPSQTTGPYEWVTHSIPPAPLPAWLLARWTTKPATGATGG